MLYFRTRGAYIKLYLKGIISFERDIFVVLFFFCQSHHFCLFLVCIHDWNLLGSSGRWEMEIGCRLMREWQDSRYSEARAIRSWTKVVWLRDLRESVRQNKMYAWFWFDRILHKEHNAIDFSKIFKLVLLKV